MAPPSIWILSLLQVGAAAAVSVSRQVQVGHVQYFVPPTEAWRIEDWKSEMINPDTEEDLIPLTAVTLEDPYDGNDLSRTFDRYEQEDDVWSQPFGYATYVQLKHEEYNGTGTHGKLPSRAQGLLTVDGEMNVTVDGTVDDGPYFLHRYTGKAYRVYRLYPDTSQAFLQSSYQDADGTHHPLPVAVGSDAGLTIAVPSRLYYKPSAKKPLAGVRIGVKDLFHLKGLRTSFGSKALYNLEPPQNTTATAVQQLIDAGAVVVGKNKLSEFAFGGSYVTEHIDYLLPVNPRGDGYNSPSDSSGGSGSAVASYDWLDASIGSDTGGSVRGPAHVNGVLGNRPTQDGVSTQGALPLSFTLDTVGLLARDPALWSQMNKILLGDSWQKFTAYPTEIILDPLAAKQIDEWNKTQPEIGTAIQNFISALEDITSGAVNLTSFDIRWNETRPSDALDLPLGQVVIEEYQNITGYEQWTEFGREFVAKYKATHDGDFPYMVPKTRQRWMKGNVSDAKDTYDQTLSHLEVYGDWATEYFLASDEESCSNALFVYFSPPTYALLYKPDVSDNGGNPFIANLLDDNYYAKVDFLNLNITLECDSNLGSNAGCESAHKDLEQYQYYQYQLFPSLAVSLAGFPDFCVPLGSFDMGMVTWSNATMKTQALPLGVDIVAAKGCDSMLYGLVEELHKRGVVKKARTGKMV